ncbi:MAG TPA: DUF547 domain-containing protein, partial [Tepidisphaeraceae bacterium]|nr:DUF547 domain-containing protein [Tepidisphaeraceae bacterium]
RATPLVIALLLATGCTPNRSPRGDSRERLMTRWDDSNWAQVLQAVVTPDGHVRYKPLAANERGVRQKLDRYRTSIARISPENRPDLFPYETDRLAYYINAHNGLALSEALRIYEDEVAGGGPRVEAREALRLFEMTAEPQFDVGGAKTTLEALANDHIRPRGDPRALLALSSMSRGSPPLRAEPYRGPDLDRQLAEQASRFLSDPRGAKPGEDGTVALSELITHFLSIDLADAYERRTGVRSENPLDWVAPYAPESSPVRIARKFVTMPFDWALNRAD